jgi:long-chain acyl-CoA synthetase
MTVRSFTVYDMFKRNAAIYRNETALLTEENRKISFKELLNEVDIVAGWLTARGVRKGDRVAVLAKNYPQYFALMGSIAAVGAIMVPINFRLTPEEIGHQLTNTEPGILFIDPDFEKMISGLSSACPSIKEVVTFGSRSEGFTPYASLLRNQPGNALPISDDDPYVIIHTAAIQGKPRGAVLSHRNIIACNIQVIGAIGLTPRDSYLNILPVFHIAGLAACMGMMHAGGRNLVISKFDPHLAVKMIDREKVSFIGDFPPILTLLLDAHRDGEFSLHPLKHVLGVELPDTIKRFEGLGHGQFWLAYGQTETMGLTSLCPNVERPGSAGKPGPLVDLKIVDDVDREVPSGQVGEIVVRGPLVFQGYWKEEELTRYTFRGGWHHTGDRGRLDEDGYLWFAGRKAEKELIKPGGENVYPVEVEKVILEHPGVHEVSVIGVPDPKFGEGIKAVCVLKPKVKVTEQELIDFVGGRIARYKKPGYVTFVDSLPKKEDGSIDRDQVKALYGK